MSSKIQQVNSVAALQEIAEEVAAQVQPGDTLLLQGELGAGKTTFTQGLAKAFGIKEPVTSPTFTVMTEYIVPKAPRGIHKLIHVDLYRLPPQPQAVEPVLQELEELANTADHVTVIEWAERLPTMTGASAITVELHHGDTPTQRTIRIEWPNT